MPKSPLRDVYGKYRIMRPGSDVEMGKCGENCQQTEINGRKCVFEQLDLKGRISIKNKTISGLTRRLALYPYDLQFHEMTVGTIIFGQHFIFSPFYCLKRLTSHLVGSVGLGEMSRPERDERVSLLFGPSVTHTYTHPRSRIYVRMCILCSAITRVSPGVCLVNG